VSVMSTTKGTREERESASRRKAFGSQPRTVGPCSPIYRPEVVAGLHLLEGLVRSPLLLATVGDAAGGAALTHFGQLLAALLAAKQDGRPTVNDGDRAAGPG
jgi:hypothetical protein